MREEFRHAVTPYAPTNSMALLDGRPFHQFTPGVIDGSTCEQVRALIQLTLDQEAHFDPRALHDAVLDGRDIAWLLRLEKE